MKKLLGFIALVALVVIPLKVSAASYSINFVNNGDLDGQSGYFTVSVNGAQSGGNSLTKFEATMTLTNVTFDSTGTITSGNWTVTVDPTNPNKLLFSSGTAVADSNFKIATLKFKKVDTAAECNVEFEVDGGKKTVTPDKKPVSNPKTGNVLPYAVISVGIVMAGAVYYVTRKNTKLYRI